MVGYLEGELGLSLGLAGEDEYTDDEDRGDGGDESDGPGLGVAEVVL